MLLAVFSHKRNERVKEGWIRTGNHIVYDKSDFAFKQNSGENAYTLSFEWTATEDNDTLLVAPVPPYSYSKLVNILKQFQEKFSKREDVLFKVSPFENSISNNTVPLV